MGRGQGHHQKLDTRNVLFGYGSHLPGSKEKSAPILDYKSISEAFEKNPEAFKCFRQSRFQGSPAFVLSESDLLVDSSSATKKEYKAEILLVYREDDKKSFEFIGICRYGPGGKNLPQWSAPYKGKNYELAFQAVAKKINEKLKKNYQRTNSNPDADITKGAAAALAGKNIIEKINSPQQS